MGTETAHDEQLPSTSVSRASDDAERSDGEERRSVATAEANVQTVSNGPAAVTIRPDRDYRLARIVAVVAGLLGAALALATPLLPVKQTTAELNWPQNGVFSSVEAPLIGYVATDLRVSVPCQAAAGLSGPRNAARTVLLSTVPKQAPKAVDRGLLIERANDDLVV